MKKMLIALALSFAALTATAEPSFDQMQTLIEQHQFAAAAQGLEVILQAHPKSAKAFYSMAQAQAGLGHLDKAALALDKAQGLDPELNFASERQVKDLRSAITPQVAKIDKIEESHFWRNLFIVLGLAGLLASIIYFARKVTNALDAPKDHEEHFNPYTKGVTDKELFEKEKSVPEPESEIKKKQFSYASSVSREMSPRSTYSAPAATQTPPAPAPYMSGPVSPTIVNNHYGSNNDGFVTGMLVGEMMSDHHNTTVIERDVIVERPVYVETQPQYVVPAPSGIEPVRSSYWDDTPSTSSRSSSWDDDSSSRSSSSSSSWSSSDSSSSSSSWDSSSSDSSSSSSWDN